MLAFSKLPTVQEFERETRLELQPNNFLYVNIKERWFTFSYDMWLKNYSQYKALVSIPSLGLPTEEDIDTTATNKAIKGIDDFFSNYPNVKYTPFYYIEEGMIALAVHNIEFHNEDHWAEINNLIDTLEVQGLGLWNYLYTNKENT